jgi:hypothetical protein
VVDVPVSREEHVRVKYDLRIFVRKIVISFYKYLLLYQLFRRVFTARGLVPSVTIFSHHRGCEASPEITPQGARFAHLIRLTATTLSKALPIRCHRHYSHVHPGPSREVGGT